MKTAPTNKKVREIITLVKEGRIIPRPEFQRRLVWTRDDKNLFLDSILNGFPFPEIYLADGDVNLETGEGTQLLVDGLQRVSTITQYFDADPELKLTTVPLYKDLDDEQKKLFLQYDVAVRDLGNIDSKEIVEVFRRINATKYSLSDIEINNAVYVGELKKFAESISENAFFSENDVFSSRDYKRMGDLRYALLIVITFITGYFNRDDLFEKYLDRYNDDFPLKGSINERIEATISLIEECGFDFKSRIWRKADLFTFMVELDQITNVEKKAIQPSEILDRMETFFSTISASGIETTNVPGVYYKATVQASNDRVNRVRRGRIIRSVLLGEEPKLDIVEELELDFDPPSETPEEEF